ncbi:putative Lysophospholipid acyltransferase LPEAT2 [Blattamonas nauphoetae]|uniref:Lysophospholipid acyltransferase LPEAT2 n=1 Tax=Blattamonas nauphoetae TaxID=2049346 RepID=A0ABQ9XTG8_9EUKA|nr:putative Lysophospholipid acyltransferase LPEAT2 [Blattamonas nauphoetae]
MVQHPSFQPFVHLYPGNSFWRWFKFLILPGPIIGLLKALCFLLAWVVFYVNLRIIFIGYRSWDKPASKWRRRLSQFALWLANIQTCLAFCIIPKYVDHSKRDPKDPKSKTHPSFSWDQSYTLVGNHLSVYDPIIGGSYLGNPSVMANGAFMNVPILGFILKHFRAVAAYRDKTDHTKRKSASEVYVDRINNPQEGEYPVCIYPEGTDTNGSCVTRFHKGAFLPGKPVRPFIIKYPGKQLNMAWDSISAVSLVWETACQFYCRFELHVFDLYYPSESEQADPELYSQNVGKFIAYQLGVPYRPECDIPHYLIASKLWNKKLTWDEALCQLEQINQPLASPTTQTDSEKKETATHTPVSVV